MTSLRQWIAAVLLASAVSPAGGVEDPATPLTGEQASEDVRILREALTRIHPGYDRYTSGAAMGMLLDDLAERAAAGTTDLDLYRDVSYVLAHIRCGHTKAELPDALVEHRKKAPSYLPFSFAVVEGRMLADRVDPRQQGLTRGDEILSINGRFVGSIVAGVEPLLAVDGWTDHAKRVEIEFSSELLGDAIDHFWPMLYGWPERWTIETRRRADGSVVELALEPVTYGRWLEIATEDDDSFMNFDTAVGFRMLDDTTAYLSIGTFVNYRRPVAPAGILGPHFDAMREAGAEHLVLDLRSCGGGSTDVPGALISYLADRPVATAKRHAWVRTFRFGDLREHLRTWDESVFSIPGQMFTDLGNGFYEMNAAIDPIGRIEPREDCFRGRVTILTSAANASGVTNLLATLREHRDDLRLVGEATGGTAEGTTAGIIFFLHLPKSGIKVRIPAIRSFNNVTRFRPGMGVVPDVEVARTVDDFVSGRDAVLAAALADGGASASKDPTRRAPRAGH